MKKVFSDWVMKLLPIGQGFKKSNPRSQGLESNKTNPANSDAIFLGWQKTLTAGTFALYNITAKQHPLYQSTVSEETLRKHRLQIPPTPPPPGQ